MDSNPSSSASPFLANLPSRGHMSSTVFSSNLGGMRVYVCDHNTSPPDGQHIKTNQQNILIRSLTLKKQKDSSSKDGSDSSRKRTAEKDLDSRASAKKTNNQINSRQGMYLLVAQKKVNENKEIGGCSDFRKDFKQLFDNSRLSPMSMREPITTAFDIKNLYKVNEPVAHLARADSLRLWCGDDIGGLMLYRPPVPILFTEGSNGQTSNRDFQSLTVEKLRALLRAKGLSTKGKKEELIARLKDADGQA